MAGRDRFDFFRKNRDYSNILDEDVEPEELEEGEEEEEYEEEDDQEEGQYEKSEPEEDPVALRERQEYLQRREKLKEVERQKLRQKLKQKLSDQLYLENDQKKKLSNNDEDYGSFFGPSEIVVARRVIVETRARKEANCIAAKVSKEDPHDISEPESDTNFEEKEPYPRKVVDESKTKAQQLKATRDYSFLFSDNAEIPVPDKGSTSILNSVTKSIPDNAQKKQPTGKNSVGALKKPVVVSSKPVSSSKEFKGIVKPFGQMSIKPGSRTISPQPNLKGSSNAKNQAGKPGSGSGCSVIQTNGSLCQPRRNGTKTVNSGSNGVKGVNSDTIKKKEPLLNASKSGKDQKRLSGSQPTNMQKTVPIKAPSQTFQPTNMQKTVPIKAPSQTFQLEQRKPTVTAKLLSKPVQKMETKLPPKPAPKPAPRPAPKLLPKSQVKPAKAPLSRELHYDRPKKRPVDDDYDLEDGGNVSSMIRQMFGYNPNKYSDMDDEDDRDMEVGFGRILAEERRSERIAREEDERELALIEAEERAERVRALKRRKLQKK